MTGKVDYNEDEFKFDLRTMLDDPMGQVSENVYAMCVPWGRGESRAQNKSTR